MGQLVLVVLAAAWAAVLVPPLVRARVENRPNSSVTDFRRQLNKLQSTVPSRAAAPMRSMARPLAPSPLQRPAAPGRPGQPAHLRRAANERTMTATRSHGFGPSVPREAPRRRTHGDPTGGYRRPEAGRAPQAAHADQLRRRRSNVLFMFVVGTVATLFLAATTREQAFLYLFALSFLATCTYLYLLSQMRQRDQAGWPDEWDRR